MPHRTGSTRLDWPRRIAQGPEHVAADHGGQIDLLGAPGIGLLIGEDLDGQRQATSGQHVHLALVAQRTHQTLARHRGEMGEDRAQCHTEAAGWRPQGIAGHFRSHLAGAPAKVR